MSWTEIALAVLNTFQVLALAWLAGRQAQVKHDLHAFNGTTLDKLDRLIEHTFESSGGSEKIV